ncbi:MAG TPA: hypothetical protein VGZ22_02510 [Isosphaeraceae bacterium]|jgi:hypothetical protein|nr:hypothetical protein [Isosphaeraceae bacterium]
MDAIAPVPAQGPRYGLSGLKHWYHGTLEELRKTAVERARVRLRVCDGATEGRDLSHLSLSWTSSKPADAYRALGEMSLCLDNHPDAEELAEQAASGGPLM